MHKIKMSFNRDICSLIYIPTINEIIFFRPKQNGKYACEVESWCPIEVDELPMGLNGQALMANAAGYTVFIKNSIAFPYFGKQYIRNNLVNKTCKSRNGIVTCKNKPCLYERGEGGNNIDDLNNGCQIFELGKMVEMAGGNFSQYVTHYF